MKAIKTNKPVPCSIDGGHGLTPILRQMIVENTERNVCKYSMQLRHSVILKNFIMVFFLFTVALFVMNFFTRTCRATYNPFTRMKANLGLKI